MFTLTAHEAIKLVRGAVAGLPVYIAGSAVAAAYYKNIDDEAAYKDVDIFTSNGASLVSSVHALQNIGFEITPRYQRVFHRWLKYGFKQWHTNSITLRNKDLGDLEVNVIYKLVDGHATTSLSQVIESFDFGLLAIGGWDMERDTYHDMRSYLFPKEMRQARAQGAHEDTVGSLTPLPMLPNKRQAWRDGFISQYNGLREIGRFLKYRDYGYNMSLVQEDLKEGYFNASLYYLDRDDEMRQHLGRLYESFGVCLDSGDFDKLKEAARLIEFTDSLDSIMKGLE